MSFELVCPGGKLGGQKAGMTFVVRFFCGACPERNEWAFGMTSSAEGTLKTSPRRMRTLSYGVKNQH